MSAQLSPIASSLGPHPELGLVLPLSHHQSFSLFRNPLGKRKELISMEKALVEVRMLSPPRGAMEERGHNLSQFPWFGNQSGLQLLMRWVSRISLPDIQKFCVH